MKKLVLLCMLTLVGCADIPRLSPEQKLLLSCQGIATTIATLAILKTQNKLTDAAVDTVNALRPTIEVACAGNWTDQAQAATLAEALLEKLKTVQEPVQ